MSGPLSVELVKFAAPADNVPTWTPPPCAVRLTAMTGALIPIGLAAVPMFCPAPVAVTVIVLPVERIDEPPSTTDPLLAVTLTAPGAVTTPTVAFPPVLE